MDGEAELTALREAGRWEEAATLGLRIYGPEIHGFLIHLLGSESDGGEVFAQVAEDLWRGLPRFSGRASFRTWLYVLARHAASRYRRQPWNRAGRRAGESQLDAAVAEARSRTAPWLRTEVKDGWRALRDALAPDDRALLVLRVDRGLPWEEVARVTLGDEEAPEPSDAELAREAARLRKRLFVLKDELRARAREAGLLDDPEGA